MLTPSELDGCIELIEELSAFAAERIVAVRPRREEISTKTTLADWVTETDLAVERHVRAAVLERFPSHQVVGEEYGTTGRDDPQARWYVDPVDGTTNFVYALPWSSFSIAVADDEGPAAGAVVDPYRGEMLAAARGRGATRNGEPIRCIDAESLTGGIVLTELSAQSLWDGLGSFMAGLAAVGCVTRIMGSNALTLANVGAGRASAAVIGAFGPVDCLAGSLIAREAGARLIAPSGADWPEPGEWFACAAPGIADELARIAGKRLNGDRA